MNLPGFSAGASLFSRSGRYHLSRVIGGAKPNMVEPALVQCPDKECDDCHCTTRCFASGGIFRFCELVCAEKCYIMFDPLNPKAGCYRYTRSCIPFIRFGG